MKERKETFEVGDLLKGLYGPVEYYLLLKEDNRNTKLENCFSCFYLLKEGKMVNRRGYFNAKMFEKVQ